MAAPCVVPRMWDVARDPIISSAEDLIIADPITGMNAALRGLVGVLLMAVHPTHAASQWVEPPGR